MIRILKKAKFLFYLLLVIISIFCGCTRTVVNKEPPSLFPDSKNKNLNTFFDEKFKFYVDYPIEWEIEVIRYIEPTKDHNGSMNAGVKIIINNNDYIFVFGQVSHISLPEANFQPFTTNSGLNGNLYIENINGNKNLKVVFNSEFIGAFVYTSEECFTKNEKQIFDILKSISIK